MGKTIVNILTSPISLIDQKVGDAISGAVITAIGIITANPFLVSFGLSRFASAVAASPKPTLTEQALKSPTPPRVSGYGEGRHHMAFALFTRASNDRAVDVGAFHDGQCDAIIGHYLADKKVVLNGSGYVQTGEAGQFGDGDKIYIGTTLGLPTETAFSEVISEVPDQWTIDHRGDGVVTGFVISKSVPSKIYQEVYPTGGPNQMPLSLVLRRQLVFDWRDITQSATDRTTWKYSENAILHLVHYLLIRDNKDWDTHFVPTLAYWTAAADDCDVAMPLNGVQTVLTAAVVHGATSIPLLSVNGLAIGMAIEISATGDTSLTETRVITGLSGNTASFSGGLTNDHPIGSQVTWGSGGGATEPRYRGCVAHQHTDPHKGVTASILSCCDGWLAPRSDGALVVYSGRYSAPTVTIGPDAITDCSIQDGIDEEAAINQIAVSYVSANHNYNVVDTDVWEDADDVAARGKILATTLSVQQPSASQGRRLAKRMMIRTMAPYRGTCTTNSRGRAAIGQRYIHLTIIQSGITFFDGPAEITKLTRNMSTGGVTFEWVAATAVIDDWNPATEEGKPAPIGNPNAPQPLDRPVIAMARFFGSDNSGTGTSGARIRITVTAPSRDDLTWFSQWRVVGAATWTEQQYNDVAAGTSITLETGFVPVGADVEVEVAYQVGDGRVSVWSLPSPVLTGSITADTTTITADSTTITADRT